MALARESNRLGGTAHTLLLARTLTRPLGRMAQALDRVERGNLDVVVQAESNDEIGVVATGVNAMASTLVGDAVNVAARLQELCKQEDVELLVSAEAHDLACAAGAQVKLTERRAAELRGRAGTILVLAG